MVHQIFMIVEQLKEADINTAYCSYIKTRNNGTAETFPSSSIRQSDKSSQSSILLCGLDKSHQLECVPYRTSAGL